MKKLLSLFLAICTCISVVILLASCDKGKMTKEEWSAMTSPELFTNYTEKTTVTDQFSKTEVEYRVVDGVLLYTANVIYDPTTGEIQSEQPWTLADYSVSLVWPQFNQLQYDKERDIYQYAENGTRREYTIKDGKIWKVYSEVSYTDETLGKIDATITTEYSNYGTTVAPAID